MSSQNETFSKCWPQNYSSEPFVLATTILILTSGNCPDCFADTLTSFKIVRSPVFWNPPDVDSLFWPCAHADHTQFHYFPPMVRLIRAALRQTFHRWKCDCISNVGGGHPRGPAVMLSCKQEEGWLHVSSHKHGGKSLGIILFKSCSRGRGDTETEPSWTQCLPSVLVFTDPCTSVGICGILLRQEEHRGELCVKIQHYMKLILLKMFFL